MSLRFAHPLLLLLLLLPPLALSLPYLMRFLYRPSALRFSETEQMKGLPPTRRQRLRSLPALLRLSGLMLVVLALARPQSGQERVIVEGEGVNIALSLDISGSMASLDFEPRNRLEAAKEVSAEFIEARRYDRIGLAVFASTAFIQSPPTPDYDVLLRLLEEAALASDLGIEDGTALGMGLATAANMLKDLEGEKVIVLLTDGVSNAGEIDPLTAAQAAAALDMRVYTIGMGRPGLVPVPRRYDSGQEQIEYLESELDEATLQRIAGITGGLYFRAEDSEALKQIYTDINLLEPSTYEITRYTRYRELMLWFLAPGVLLLLVDFILGLTVFRTLP